ncbi:dynamin family protein [Thermithiobacillus plumbiphilus]|uniref:Dynamin family protein n=1 Tax=Thermithiobacillus plumbiphilus TaxID=1729899 RepID=A0ABU9D7Q8_9PROT
MLTAENLILKWSAALEILAAHEPNSQENKEARELLRRAVGLLGSTSKKPTLVLAGGFSVGKSRVINAILGLDLAPTAIEPTTARPTRFQYGQEISYEFIDDKGNKQRFNAEMFAQLQHNSASGNDAYDSKKVVSALVSAPIPLLKHVDLLDTPGINSIGGASTDTSDAQRTAAALNDPDASAVVWVMSASKGGVQDWEIGHLRELRRAGKYCCGLINQADLVSPRNRATILKKIRDSGLFDKVILFSAELRQYRDQSPTEINNLDGNADLTFDWESDVLLECLHNRDSGGGNAELQKLYSAMIAHMIGRIEAWNAEVARMGVRREEARKAVRMMLAEQYQQNIDIYAQLSESKAQKGYLLSRAVSNATAENIFSSNDVDVLKIYENFFIPMMDELFSQHQEDSERLVNEQWRGMSRQLSLLGSEAKVQMVDSMMEMSNVYREGVDSRAVIVSMFFKYSEYINFDYGFSIESVFLPTYYVTSLKTFMMRGMEAHEYTSPKNDQASTLEERLLTHLQPFEAKLTQIELLGMQLVAHRDRFLAMADLNQAS